MVHKTPLGPADTADSPRDFAETIGSASPNVCPIVENSVGFASMSCQLPAQASSASVNRPPLFSSSPEYCPTEHEYIVYRPSAWPSNRR